MHIREAVWPADQAVVTDLLRAYFVEYREELGAQDLDQELAELGTRYDGRHARMWVAEAEGMVVGCIALRPIPGRPDDGELKRMTVAASHRGRGIGAQLVQHLVSRASGMGVQHVLLDTVPRMQAARRIYERAGFTVCGAYYGSPLCGAVFMEKWVEGRPRAWPT